MAKEKTCTFKNDKDPTGLMRIGYNKGAIIKFEGKMCGRISAPSWSADETKYRVRLMVADNLCDITDNGDWRWIKLLAEFETLDAAKEWTKEIFPVLRGKYDLRFIEPD